MIVKLLENTSMMLLKKIMISAMSLPPPPPTHTHPHTPSNHSCLSPTVGDQYYRLNNVGVDDGFPKPIRQNWPGITGPVNAAFSVSEKSTYACGGGRQCVNSQPVIYVFQVSSPHTRNPSAISVRK